MSTWEERMAGATHVFIPPLDDACEIGDPDSFPGHYGHHTHVQGNGFICSCGLVFGCFSYVPDPRLWSENPAERSAAQEDAEAYEASISCSICGMRGVVAEEDWGPREG